MKIYRMTRPSGEALTAEERALLPLLSQAKRDLCSGLTPRRTARTSFYGEVLALWVRSLDSPPSLPEIRYAPSGKPFYGDNALFYSLSHSGDNICLALSPTPVGIDCEAHRPPSEAVMRRFFTPSQRAQVMAADDKEAEFARIWTGIEAYAKYTGKGLTLSPDTPPDAPLSIALSEERMTVSVYPPPREWEIISVTPQRAVRDLKKYL